MRKPNRNGSETRMFTIEEASTYAGMGKTYFRKWASEIGAVRVFSPRLTRYDRTVIDKALDEMEQNTESKY